MSTKLWHLSCVFEGKHLEAVMWDLAGKVNNLDVRPMKDAEKEPVTGRVKAAVKGSMAEKVLAYIKQHNKETVTSTEVKDLLRDRPPTAAYAVIYDLIARGRLALTVKGSGVYKVVPITQE